MTWMDENCGCYGAHIVDFLVEFDVVLIDDNFLFILIVVLDISKSYIWGQNFKLNAFLVHGYILFDTGSWTWY